MFQFVSPFVHCRALLQIERKVKETVEDALLDQGIEAFRYVEGTDVERAGGGRKGARDGDA